MKKLLTLLFIVTLSPLLASESVSMNRNNAAPATLAERLGFKATDRILIVNGDDVGMSHASVAATIDAMENGLMTTGTIMVPCPWFLEVAAYARSHPQSDFGLHLTHTSEWKTYKWGPVASKTDVPGLVDPQGYLWPDIMNVYSHSTPEQAYIEARAQIQKALAAGIDVTHLDSHMGTLQYNLTYYEVYRRLAREFDLPLRMASQDVLAARGGENLRKQLEADGVLCPDFLIHGDRNKGESVADYWKRQLKALKPGVTELYIHAALAGDEMKHITNSWQERAEEHRLFTSDKEIRAILDSLEVKRIGFRPLRDLQRKMRAEKASRN
jgi:hypothetical protein